MLEYPLVLEGSPSSIGMLSPSGVGVFTSNIAVLAPSVVLECLPSGVRVFTL